MSKIMKNSKRGFTLVEMVLVIAIIVILAAVMIAGIGDYLSRARKAASEVTRHYSETDSIIGEIEDQAPESRT